MSTQHQSRRTQADPRDFPISLSDAEMWGDRSRREKTVIINKWELNRWQKHGHDRLYFRDADGYIDVDSGAVEGDAPVADVTVREEKGDTYVCYWMETDAVDHRGKEFVAAIKR